MVTYYKDAVLVSMSVIRELIQVRFNRFDLTEPKVSHLDVSMMMDFLCSITHSIILVMVFSIFAHCLHNVIIN